MSSNENKILMKADLQNPEGSRNRNMQSNAEKENPLQEDDLSRLAPIEREYFMRINRKEQSTSVNQPENWRARPPLSPAEPSRNRSGTYGARGRASGAEDELFPDPFGSGPMYQEPPNFALVLTWSSYLKKRRATVYGVRAALGMSPAENMPPIENWRDRPAPQFAIDAGTAPGSNWRRHLDQNNDRRQSNSTSFNQGNRSQGHRGTPTSAAELFRGSQGQQTRARSEFQGHQQWDRERDREREREREREPRQNYGPHGQRNQWTNSGFYDPPTRNDGRNYHGRNQNQAPGNRGNPNGLNGATGGQAAHRRGEASRGLISLSGFQRTRSFGPSLNDRPPPGNGANPGRRGSS
ncbi:uncharacterized protein [Drosophila pseudoobscura]|uniref:Uncharacterized protein n=1 Tax=Drosophila pseudoobscura pseudoobscura TaxID=46245 RepID=A0A6I8UZX9_DROPS|nr:uncharacterized protein LOC6901153 [Drosophila pseudoobscura]